MSTQAPLAAAAERLRKRQGRPRKEQLDADPVPHHAAVEKLGPPSRLLDVAAAAAYLSVSVWTIRDLVAGGTLRRVSIPGAGGRDLRVVRLDREDLDGLIATWKDPA